MFYIPDSQIWLNNRITSVGVVLKILMSRTYCSSTYAKIGVIQKRLAWPLCKDGTQIHEVLKKENKQKH